MEMESTLRVCPSVRNSIINVLEKQHLCLRL